MRSPSMPTYGRSRMRAEAETGHMLMSQLSQHSNRPFIGIRLIALLTAIIPVTAMGQASERADLPMKDRSCEVLESRPGAMRDTSSLVYGIILNNTPQASDIEY